MTARMLRLSSAVLAAVVLGACGGGALSVDEATQQACAALDGIEGSVGVLAEGASGTVDSVREAGNSVRDAVAEMGDEVREALDDEAITRLEQAHNAYRRAVSGVEDAAGLEAVGDELVEVGADLRARYTEAVTSLGC
ncbi:MAG: hypothetical protein ACR2JP_07155 [Acidimicrobiia bacterium]